MTRPTFGWTHVGEGGISVVPDDWYQVVVVGESVVHDQWYEFINYCLGTECFVTPDINLIDGTYSWYVRSFNTVSREFTESDPSTFIVDTDGIPSPDVIAKIVPQNDDSYTSGLIKFEWLPDQYALWYRLVIISPTGFVYDQWYEGTTVCRETCTVWQALPSDGFEWYMVGWGPGGMGSWGGPVTSASNFSVGINVPGLIQPIYPAPGSGLTVTDGIQPQWDVEPNTAWYRINITGPNDFEFDEWISAGEACVETICTLPTPVYLTSGIYTWRMLGWNAAGMGSWNNASNFSINTPAPA